MKSLNRLIAKFSEVELIENTFKFIIWLSILALLLRGIGVLCQDGHLFYGIVLIIIWFVLALQIFWFGVVSLLLPFMTAIFPDTDFVETNNSLKTIERSQRVSIMWKLVKTPQSIVFLFAYCSFGYIMIRLFEALLAQRGIS